MAAERRRSLVGTVAAVFRVTGAVADVGAAVTPDADQAADFNEGAELLRQAGDEQQLGAAVEFGVEKAKNKLLDSIFGR